MTALALVAAAFRRRPLRCLLTVGGVGIALGTFLCFQSLSRGLESSWASAYQRSGTDIIVAQDNAFNTAMEQHVGDEIQRLSGIRAVAPLFWGLSTVDGRPGTPLGGYRPGAFPLATLSVRGRWFREGAAEAVLGAQAARRFGKEIGDSITISGAALRVVGVSTSPNLQELESVYVPLDVLQRLRGTPGIVTAFFVAVARRTDDHDARGAIDAAVLAIQRRFPRLVAYRTEEFARNNELINMARATAWGSSVIAFGVAVLGVVNTMSMAVLERTREIGLLRALGWRRWRVLTLLLWESLSLTTAGGCAGILLGVAGLHALTHVPRMRLLAITAIPPALYVQTLVLGVTLGVFGGLLPAYRASRILPIDALRYE